MSEQVSSITDANDLPITLYLNQRLAFDLLASLKGGFSSFSTVQTTSDTEAHTSGQGGAQFGVKNVFGLFSISLGAQGARQKMTGQGATKTEEIIHTPTSLFAQLRKDLKERNLVQEISPPVDVENFSPGDFIEFKATLRRNPLVDMLDTLSMIFQLIEVANKASPRTPQAGGNRKKSGGHQIGNTSNSFSGAKKKLEALKSMIASGESEDLIAETGALRTVMTVEGRYFIDPTMNDIIDGTFRVFGKVVRVVESNGESISLFRKAALGKFVEGENILDGMTENMSSIGYKETLETEIAGPAIQIIPIAIYS